MIKNGDIVYFIINGYIMNGRVIDLKQNEKNVTFSIEGYAGCGGQHIINSSQLHHTVFLEEQEAMKYIDNPQMYLQITC